MKAVKKCSYILFLAVGLLLALFLGFRWLDRSREFSSLLPFSLQEVTACYATLECFYPDDPAQEKSLHTQLTQTQTQDLLERLSQSTYRREGSASGLSSETNSLIRIYLHTSGSSHSELMLNGELLLVNPLTYRGDSVTYRPEGDSLAQYQALSAFLQSCMK